MVGQIFNSVNTQLTVTCSKSTIKTSRWFEICSKLTIKTPEKNIFIVNFEHISNLFASVFIVDFEQVKHSLSIFVNSKV